MKTSLTLWGYVGCLLACLTSQAQMPTKQLTMTPKATKLFVDSVRQALLRHYVFADKAALMGNYLQDQFKKGAYRKLTGPVQLAELVGQDLQSAHHDGHLNIRYDPGMAEMLSKPPTTDDAPPDSLELARLQGENYGFPRVEILPGNIGYVSITGFVGAVALAKPTVSAAFRFVSHTRALIIDLRVNRGGDPEMVRLIESYFFPQRTHLMDMYIRSENRTQEFWADPALADSLLLTMPVYVLTSKYTPSGAEDFSYAMQSAKRAQVVGDTTWGGAHLTFWFNVGQGFVVAIPCGRPINPYTKTNWEGTGVIPDIAVPASQALSATQSAIFHRFLEQATNEQEKRSAQWQLNWLKASDSAVPLDSARLASYVGIYQGGLDFFVKSGHFFCKNAERGNAVFELKAITDTLFVLDESVQMEFEKDASGVYSSIKMHWVDGNTSQKARIK